MYRGALYALVVAGILSLANLCKPMQADAMNKLSFLSQVTLLLMVGSFTALGLVALYEGGSFSIWRGNSGIRIESEH